MAELTGTRPRTVEAWLRIGVPHKHFSLLVEAARRRGIRGLSFETLYAAKTETIRRYGGRAA